MLRKPSLLLLSVVFLGACTDTPTQPDTEVGPQFAAINGGNGNGVQFTTSPYAGIGHFDDDGDLCQVQNLETGAADSSDWQRINKDGSVYLHIQDAVATIRIFPAAGGVLSGTGRWSLNWHFGDGTRVSTAHGTVSDGVDTYRARCTVRRTKSGNLHRDISW